MYGLVTFSAYRDSEDPRLQRMELYKSLDQAVERANALMDAYHRKYGEDYSERATAENLMAVAGNGDVTWRAWISEVEPPALTTITVLPLENGVIPIAMPEQLICAVPPGKVTTWPDMKAYLAKLYGDEAVQASLPSFRAVFGEAVME
jgi:hypothetical protein